MITSIAFTAMYIYMASNSLPVNGVAFGLVATFSLFAEFIWLGALARPKAN